MKVSGVILLALTLCFLGFIDRSEAARYTSFSYKATSESSGGFMSWNEYDQCYDSLKPIPTEAIEVHTGCVALYSEKDCAGESTKLQYLQSPENYYFSIPKALSAKAVDCRED